MLKRWYTLAFATGAMTMSLAASVSADGAPATGADMIMEEVVVTARRH